MAEEKHSNLINVLKKCLKEIYLKRIFIQQNRLSDLKIISCYQHVRTQGVLFPWALPEEYTVNELQNIP